MQSFTARMPLLTAASAFGLGRSVICSVIHTVVNTCRKFRKFGPTVVGIYKQTEIQPHTSQYFAPSLGKVEM